MKSFAMANEFIKRKEDHFVALVVDLRFRCSSSTADHESRDYFSALSGYVDQEGP